MHARITIGTFQTGKLEEAIKIDRDSIVPALKKQKGFKGYYGLIDRKTGKAIAISLWNMEADMMAAEGSGSYRELLAKLMPLGAGRPPTMEHYEVSVQG